MMFHFGYPVVLSLLTLVLGWLLFTLRRRPASVTYSMSSKMAEFVGGSQRLWVKVPLILRASCLILLVLAAARPQLFNVSKEIHSPGVDIILCLDTSGSMQAQPWPLRLRPGRRV